MIRPRPVLPDPPPAAAGDPAAPGHAAPAADRSTRPARPAGPPVGPARPVRPGPADASGRAVLRSAAHRPADRAPAAGTEPRRFMTATDFLDRRADAAEPGPASWGWRGRVRRWSGGSIKPRMGPAERAYEQDRALIQKDFDGPVTIAFINPKGGAAKTTGVLAAGYTFGTVRGGGVVAWDNNETRGTLGIRGSRSSHTKTTKELLSRPRQVLRRVAVADRRPRLLRPLAGRRALRRTRLRRERQRHRPDPRRRLQLDPPAADALLPRHPGRHRQQHAGRELAGRGRRRRPARRHLARSARTPATAACGCSTRSRTPATRT